MWSAGYPSLEIEHQPGLERALAAICLGIGFAVPWVLQLETSTSVLASALSTLMMALLCWRAGWMGRRFRIARAQWHAPESGADDFTLIDARGVRFAARLGAGTRVTSVFVLLQWRSRHGMRRMLLLRPSRAVQAFDAWRRLAVRLRLQGAVERVDRDLPHNGSAL